MSQSLESVELKIARAAEYLDALGKEASAYLDSNPYEVVGQAQPEGGPPLLVFKVHQHPPLRLSVLLGDFLYNLRSSLDHLAWQLVLANGGTPESGPGGTQFPILEKRGKNPIKIAGGVHADALRLIEDLQPYNHTSASPRKDPLWILNTLNNIDKHREFNIAVLNVSEMIQAHLLTADGTGIYMTFQFLDAVGMDEPITDGAVIGTPPLPAGPDQKWGVEFRSRLGLQETREAGLVGSPTLYTLAEQLLEYVRDNVIPQFERFFV